MADLFNLSATELAALLCSRVCHDIISPVGAINNGLELLDEGSADEDAMKLIRASARNASARLQFARIAFGAAGSAGMLIDTGDAEAVAIAFLANEKPEEPIDAHSIQPYYTLLLAREAGMTISIRASAEDIVLTAA